ncbi:MAG: SOS response-associated peptidase [Magnetococcales bacterium]|nr:SOS response-associated peptidase [Magnetococcales bacterium]
MCGRFSQADGGKGILEHLGIFNAAFAAPARYNIAPSQLAVVIRRLPDQNIPVASLLRWGLIPHWAKDPMIGMRLINARSETVAEKPSFREAFVRRRCLIPTNGFYEWQGKGRDKQAYFIGMADHQSFAIGGLWESWQSSETTRIETFTILTTRANACVAPIHDRMPVIVACEHYAPWLDHGTPMPVCSMAGILSPFPAARMVSHPVSDWVNNPAHDSELCVQPVDVQKSLW